MTIDLVALPLVLGVAATAALSDWRSGTIPNRLLAWGAVAGAAWLLFTTVWLLCDGPGQSSVMRAGGPWGHLLDVVVNAVVAFALGLLLWWVGVWAAGDAKLFALLAFLLPLDFYETNLLAVFPSFVLFFNTFVCILVLLAAELAYKLVLRLFRPGAGRATAGLVRRAIAFLRGKGFGLVRIVLGFMAIFMTIRVGRHFARAALGEVVTLNKTLVYVVLFLLFAPLTGFLMRPRVFAVVCVVIVGYAILSPS